MNGVRRHELTDDQRDLLLPLLPAWVRTGCTPQDLYLAHKREQRPSPRPEPGRLGTNFHARCEGSGKPLRFVLSGGHRHESNTFPN